MYLYKENPIAFSEALKHDLSIIEAQPNTAAVLRRRKDTCDLSLLQQEATYMGFGYHVRDISETVNFMLKLQGLDVPVPIVLDAGADYIVEEYIQGTPLHHLIAARPSLTLADRFLQEVLKAHQRGVILGDRWGKNEIVRSNGQICFVDFDLEYRTPFDRELELAEAINGLAIFSSDHRLSQHLASWVRSSADLQGYNQEKIIWFLARHQTFWGDPQGLLTSIVRGGK